MLDIWHFVTTWTEVGLALALLYFRFCLYESEEGRLQSALADVWIRTADRSESTRARLRRLLTESARLSLHFLDLLLGPKLLSFRALSTFGFLIMVSGAMTNALLRLIQTRYVATVLPLDLHHRWADIGVVAFVSLVFFYFALAPVTIHKRWAKYLPVAGFLLIQILIVVTHTYLVWVVFALDYLWLIAIRREIEQALRSNSTWRHVLVLVGGLIVTVACFVLFPGKYHEGAILNDWVWTQSDDMKGAMFLLSDSRFCIAAVSMMQLCIIAVCFLIWAMWLILSRVIYAAERYEFFRQRKWFGTLGVALLVHAASGGGWIKTIMETIAKTGPG
jgi:hypothetical protein